MLIAKESGTYYTPLRTVEFMCDYVAAHQKKPSSILEPSAGDGRFVCTLLKRGYGKSYTAIEYDSEKIPLLRERINRKSTHILENDFLEFAQQSKRVYDLIIGNPPYISIKNMKKSFLQEARNLCERFSLPTSLVKNSWVAFILGSMCVLAPGGAIFFVLPVEFLQVQYAEVLRDFLEKHFNTIQILTFKEKMFPKIEQNTCLVFLANQERKTPYILYRQYKTLSGAIVLHESQIKRNKPLKKWTNAVLSDSDIDLLRRLADYYPHIDTLVTSTPGIVTGANKVFILNHKEVAKYKCEKFVQPIISKASTIRCSFAIDHNLVRKLSEAGEKIYFLNLNGIKETDLPRELRLYLQESGRIKRNNIEIRNSYKCSRRNPWYAVPVTKSGDAVFFKRYDSLPRICVKLRDIYTTDIAYNLIFKENIDPASFVFSFYNSLTLAHCEFLGRYYGGGVSELIPKEFKQLPMPYQNTQPEDIQKLAKMLQNHASLENILNFVDARTLGSLVGESDILRLRAIRNRLMIRRL